MEDLSSNELFQQRHARAISGEDLEVLGKRASADWSAGKYESLSDAVVGTVKHACLGPEQVRRVVEFTNTDAFLREFRKEGSSKYVEFANGPADPRAVLQDLNDGGGGSVFDPGTGDYHQPPERKTASDDSALLQAFSATEVQLPEHNPLGEVITLRDKLASAKDNYTAELHSCENMLQELQGRLFNTVKQAALSGHSLGEIVNIWERYAPDPIYVKVAFDTMTDDLVANGVFFSTDELVASLQKVASSETPNPQHPLVLDFSDFCSVVSKLAQLHEDRKQVQEGFNQLTTFIKNAAGDGGLVGKGIDAVKWTANRAGEHGKVIGEKLLGKDNGKYLGHAAKGVVYAAPALAAHEVYRGTVKHSPIKQRVLAAVPGTSEYNQREYQLAANAQGGQFY